MKSRLLGAVCSNILACCAFSLSINASASIVNAGFETGALSGWTSGGQAGVQTSVVKNDTYAAWVGTVDFDKNNANDFTGEAGTLGYTNNSISQAVDVTGMGSLDLWYNFYTWDYSSFDAPGFEIQINSTSVLSISAGDLSPSENGVLDSTGWQLFSYDLTGYASSTLDLVIYSGNTGDASFQSWTYIDGLDVVLLPTAVPVPAAAWLFGSGLLGLVGIARRKKA